MKLDENTVNKLKEAFSIGADVSAACYYAEISRQTYYNWEKDNPKLKEEFDRLKERPILKAYQTVAKTLGDSYQNAMDYLKRKRKIEFGDNSQVDVNFNVNIKDYGDNKHSTPTETE